MSDHTSPCPDMLTTCIDLECQVRKGLRQHLLTNISQANRPKASEVALVRLDRMLSDSQYGSEPPEFFLAALVEGIETFFSTPAMERPTNAERGRAVGKRMEAERKAKQAADREAAKAQDRATDPEEHVNTTTTKAIRIPRVAKHQPRTTDNKEHPVTERITMTKDEMARTIRETAERIADDIVAERMAAIEATPVTAPEDKPVEIVKAKGGRKKVERITADKREFAGTTLPAIVVNESLTIPALEVGEESIDTVATPKVRSPYNKARYRLDKTPSVLDADTTTYRVLMTEHLRIAALVGVTVEPAKAPKAKTVTPQAVVDTGKKAKKHAKKVAALVLVTGCTKAEAEAILASK